MFSIQLVSRIELRRGCVTISLFCFFFPCPPVASSCFLRLVMSCPHHKRITSTVHQQQETHNHYKQICFLKWKNLWHCHNLQLFSYICEEETKLWVKRVTYIHLQNALETIKCGSVQSVFICARQQWSSVGNTIIHAATRGQWSTGNKHESHWDTNRWRCCIVEEDGLAMEKANHQSYFIWFRCIHVCVLSHCIHCSTGVALRPHTAVRLTSAKVAFEFL